MIGSCPLVIAAVVLHFLQDDKHTYKTLPTAAPAYISTTLPMLHSTTNNCLTCHAIAYLPTSVPGKPSPLPGNSSSFFQGYLECHLLSEAFANPLTQWFSSFSGTRMPWRAS